MATHDEMSACVLELARMLTEAWSEARKKGTECEALRADLVRAVEQAENYRRERDEARAIERTIASPARLMGLRDFRRAQANAAQAAVEPKPEGA